MINSRKDGTLIVKSQRPYFMAVNGQQTEKHIIICKDINRKAEYIAFDLEHYLRMSLSQIPKRDELETPNPSEQAEQEKRTEEFYKNNSPSVQDVEEQATMIEMIVGLSTGVSLSKLVQTFEGLIGCGLILMEGNIQMPFLTWQQLHRDDKLKIMFCYIAFFVNPLQKLAQMSIRMESSRAMQGQIQNTKTQSESEF